MENGETRGKERREPEEARQLPERQTRKAVKVNYAEGKKVKSPWAKGR